MMSELQEHTSVVITTNLSFGERASVFGDAKMANACSIGFHCHTVETGNDSWRFQNSRTAEQQHSGHWRHPRTNA